jgi:hypothetical protein
MAGSRKVETPLVWLLGNEKEVSRFLPRFRGLCEIVRRLKVSSDNTDYILITLLSSRNFVQIFFFRSHLEHFIDFA